MNANLGWLELCLSRTLARTGLRKEPEPFVRERLSMALRGELYTAGPFGEEQIESVKRHFNEMLGQEVSFEVKEQKR